ncbi:hypothetical protein SynPROS71_02125 [Synechococcus sp. PROS-7-1]|uniref:hypothetical protein n=1 Tax=Synechococcus sp. PROS-7-1 TaxID=1442556 RepID=UPI001648B921|nr:hypothetical protein [Synechococcus sp. PROS-7-1]QNI85897.1 hypothetical protein SynPROS71_02125 [Synechococcus sp. PROS-7-1]
MTFSPYQHQDPRQTTLQRQIEQSRQVGDAERLQRLELQWVHRFGVASLPAGDRPMVQPEIHQIEIEQEIEQPAAEVSQERHQSPSGIGRFTALLRDSLDDVARTLDESSGDAFEQNRSASASAPVPVASPQRLRRWLTPVTSDEFPKAS